MRARNDLPIPHLIVSLVKLATGVHFYVSPCVTTTTVAQLVVYWLCMRKKDQTPAGSDQDFKIGNDSSFVNHSAFRNGSHGAFRGDLKTNVQCQ